jgi:hypothetical protein
MFIYEEISEFNVNKFGESSLHLRAKGGVVYATYLIHLLLYFLYHKSHY